MEVADDWKRRWAWWEVLVIVTFGLEEKLESEENEDKREGCIEQDVFHGFVRFGLLNEWLKFC